MIDRSRDTPDSTADQQGWTELSQAVRNQLLRLALTMPAMNPEEASKFIAACRDALLLHQDALIFDHDIETRNARTAYSDGP